MKKICLLLLFCCLGNFAFALPNTASIALSTPVTVVPANACPRTTGVIIYEFTLTGSGAGMDNLTGISFTQSGTAALTGDIVNYKLWGGATFGTATELAISSSGTNFTVTAIDFDAGVSENFWITADIATAPTAGHTIIVNAMTAGNVGTTNGATSSGTIATGGTQTIGLPTVTTVSPLMGYPASAVTITGVGFNTTPASNIVFFGATRATVTASTTTSLSVTVPTGATFDNVIVDNAACALTASSNNFFLPTYNNTAYVSGIVNMDPKVDFTTGSNAHNVAIGDLDGDGKPDLAVANNNGISVYFNTSSTGSITAGSFASELDFPTTAGPWGVSIGDLDGDGKPEIIGTDFNAGTISVLYNTTVSSGTITAASFAPAVDFTVGMYPISVAIRDLNGDGRPDLAVSNYASGNITILRNATVASGTITPTSFVLATTLYTLPNPNCVAAGDLDGDGKPDLVVSNQNSAKLGILRNTTVTGSNTITFATHVDFTTGNTPYGIAIGDIDGDGKPDLVVANEGINTVSVFRNAITSSGPITLASFAGKVDFAVGTSPFCPAIGDIDGDGKPDIVVANRDANTVSVLRNATVSSGTITPASFSAHADFAVTNQPFGVAVGDLDGDGKADIVSTNVGGTTISILRNYPVQNIAPQTTTICGGTTTSLSDGAMGGVWSSSNTSVATVNTHGRVTGAAGGTTIISYTLPGGTLTATVTVNAAPTIYTFTGGGPYCALDSGVHVGLTLSDTGISYQLYNGSTAVGSAVAGTGAAIDFGLDTAVGVYHAIATNTVTACTSYLSGITISINPLPDTFTVTGGGSYCATGPGMHVGLDGSAIGNNYQLYLGSSPVGSIVPGTGGALDFGLQTAAGLYWVIASNAITNCPKIMADTVAVTIIPLPTADMVTGGGSYCASDSGVHVGLNTSDAGTIYQLYHASSPIGTPVTSAGGALDFGLQVLSGVYTVYATNPVTTCSSMMTGSVTVTVNPLPVVYNVTGGGSYCAGGTGVPVGLSNSDHGISYQLYTGATTTGSALNGINAALSFGLITVADTYRVVATDTTTGCMSAMNDTITVSITPVVVPHMRINTGEGAGDTVCGGAPVTFTAQTLNGGTTPGYQWAVNNLYVGTNDSTYTYTPAPFDVIAVMMASSAACAMPDSLYDTMKVQIQTPETPSVFIIVTPATSIAGGQADTLIAVPTNCGSSPRYQWFNNGNPIAGATNVMYTSSGFTNHDSISVRVLTSGACGGRITDNSVIITLFAAGVTQVTQAVGDVRLMPNPNKGTFTVQGTLGSVNDEEVSIEITDMLGQVVYSNKVTAHNGAINEQIQLSSTLANGMYLLNLLSATDHKVFHFVVTQ